MNFSAHISDLVNLPGTIFQWLAMEIGGFSIFALRLPAVILTLLAAALLIWTVVKWSRASIAIISGFAIVASTLFVGLTHAGTNAALMIFWLAVMIFFATQVLLSSRGSWRTTIYKIALCIAGSLLIYSPGGIYFAIILALVALIHPKSRLLFLRLKLWKILVGIFIGLIIVSPLILGVILQAKDGEFGLLRELLMLTGQFSFANLQSLATAFVAVRVGFAGGFILPVLSIASVMIAVLGLVKVAKDIFSARSYLTLSLLLLSLILSALNPAMLGLLIVPLTLLLSVGFLALVEFWYRFFPRNPFARTLAAVMLVVLVVSAGWLDIMRSFTMENYSAQVVYNYNREFAAVRTEILRNKSEAVTLVVPSSQQDFYGILVREFPKLTIATNAKNPVGKLMILDSAKVKPNKIPTKIVTNSLSRNSVLMRVY